MKVEEKHLVGEIKYFPLHVVQAMVDEQVRQGNKADPSVFARCLTANRLEGGFSWNKSVLGLSVWCQVLAGHDYSHIPKPTKSKDHIHAKHTTGHKAQPTERDYQSYVS